MAPSRAGFGEHAFYCRSACGRPRRNVGLWLCHGALAEGAGVTIASRSAEKVRGALARLGNAANGECVDVTDKAGLERFFAGLGAFDHLAITVGDPLLSKQIMELTDEEARSAFEVRFWGQFNAVRAAYPHIRKTGSITLVSGLAGQRASPGRGICAGVLGGVEGMVKSFAAELRPLRINGVCAGAVDTELWHRLPEAERQATFDRIGARLPVGRVGKPEDIAEAYLYLMKTGFSTGETVVIDGGALQAP
ncbi:MAG TPA: SDR family oxidoreductase [Stellaceae bacterium]|nr:SDR family oxidoreductase [Stellaceae bacterium]